VNIRRDNYGLEQRKKGNEGEKLKTHLYVDLTKDLTLTLLIGRKKIAEILR
jgi:hypothetical protein